MVGGLAWYTQWDDSRDAKAEQVEDAKDEAEIEAREKAAAEKAADRRANICAVAEQGDQNLLNLFIEASANPDPDDVAAARAFIAAGFEDCTNPNPTPAP